MNRCEICLGFLGPPDHDRDGDCVLVGTPPVDRSALIALLSDACGDDLTFAETADEIIGFLQCERRIGVLAHATRPYCCVQDGCGLNYPHYHRDTLDGEEVVRVDARAAE